MAVADGAEHGFEPRIGRSVSLDEAARLMRVSRRTIYNRIRHGRLQTIRTIGGSQRIVIASMLAAVVPEAVPDDGRPAEGWDSDEARGLIARRSAARKRLSSAHYVAHVAYGGQADRVRLTA
jgi:excisionase family DNA binding protein